MADTGIAHRLHCEIRITEESIFNIHSREAWKRSFSPTFRSYAFWLEIKWNKPRWRKKAEWKKRRRKNNSDSFRSWFFLHRFFLLLSLSFRLSLPLVPFHMVGVVLWRCCVSEVKRRKWKRDRQNRQSFIRKSLVENQCWLMFRFNEPQWKVDLIIEPLYELSIKSDSIRAANTHWTRETEKNVRAHLHFLSPSLFVILCVWWNY